MIYNLLKRIQNLLASKPSGTKEEQEILSLVSQALPAMLNGHDTEHLPPMSCWYGYAPTPNGRSSYAITATGSACACTMGRRKRMPSTWTYAAFQR